jgi:hypothetical protein
MDRIEKGVSNISSIVACVFVAAVTFLLSRCLATIWGYTCRHTSVWEGFMKYAVEIGSVGTVYILNFIKTGSGIQKLIHRQTDRIAIS